MEGKRKGGEGGRKRKGGKREEGGKGDKGSSARPLYSCFRHLWHVVPIWWFLSVARKPIISSALLQPRTTLTAKCN